MPEAYIIDACRSPRGVGKPGKGALAHIQPQRRSAHPDPARSLLRSSPSGESGAVERLSRGRQAVGSAVDEEILSADLDGHAPLAPGVPTL